MVNSLYLEIFKEKLEGLANMLAINFVISSIYILQHYDLSFNKDIDEISHPWEYTYWFMDNLSADLFYR